jgi:hypothetical protein
VTELDPEVIEQPTSVIQNWSRRQRLTENENQRPMKSFQDREALLAVRSGLGELPPRHSQYVG